MTGSLNRVILIGHLGADPEENSMQDGRSVLNLRLATTDVWRDKNTGERRERTEWHRVVIFAEKLVEVAKQYLKKGSKVFVEGRLRNSEWEDSHGQRRFTTEVVLQGFNSSLILLDRPTGLGSSSEKQDKGYERLSPSASFDASSSLTDDEIPF